MKKTIFGTIIFLLMCAYSSARPPAHSGQNNYNGNRFQSYSNYYDGRQLRPGFNYNSQSGWYRQGYFNSRFGYVPVVPNNYYTYPPRGGYFNPYFNPNWSSGW